MTRITNTSAQNWRTPRDLYRGLDAEYGFTIDGAATADNAKHWRFVTPEQDAFKFDFTGERVWCNPPFKMIWEFLGLAIWWAAKGVFWCVVVPASTDTAWFHDLAPLAEKHCFRGRVKFEPPPGVKMSTPTLGTMLCLFGPGTTPSGLGFACARDPKTGRRLP